MCIYSNSREAFRRRHIAQVLSEAALIDLEIFKKREKNGRNDAIRDIVGMAWHDFLLCLD
jgi:hypothetical protein